MSMKLKVSVRTAISTVESLIQKGLLLYEKPTRQITANEITAPSMIGNRFCFMDVRVYPKQEGIRIIEWNDNAEHILTDVFDDVWLQIHFIHICKPAYIESDQSTANEFLIEKLKILENSANELNKMIKTPLVYLPERTAIKYQDTECELLPSSKQAAVCKYVFENNDEGENIDIAMIDHYLSGENEMKSDQVKNAAIEINKKTNDAFGFPIFKISLDFITIKSVTQSH